MVIYSVIDISVSLDLELSKFYTHFIVHDATCVLHSFDQCIFHTQTHAHKLHSTGGWAAEFIIKGGGASCCKGP